MIVKSAITIIRADLFAAVKGSITLRFASYQSALFLTLLPYTSIAALYVALRELFHFVVVSVDKLLWKLLSRGGKMLDPFSVVCVASIDHWQPFWFCIMKLFCFFL